VCQRRRGDKPVRRVAVLELIGLGKHRDSWSDRQDPDGSRSDDVLDELHRVDAWIQAAFGDQHADLPKADVADRQGAVLALQGTSCADGEPPRLKRIMDQDVRVNDDHVRRSSARRTGS